MMSRFRFATSFLLLLLLSASRPAFGEAFSVAAVLRHDEALDEAHDVELHGDLAVIPGKGGSIAVVDVGDPTQPELVWFRHDREALPDAETVLPANGRLFLGTMDFHSIDLADPQAPVFEAVVSDRPRIARINGMVRRGQTIFAANKHGWIAAFDVPMLSLPVKPRPVVAELGGSRW